VEVVLVFRLELVWEALVFIEDRDCILVFAKLVALPFFWIDWTPPLLTVPERLETREFSVGLMRFFPTDDRTEFPDG
jgi:hypothetical protein